MVSEKKRYLLLQIECPRRLSAEEAKHAVYEAVFGLLGEEGAAKAVVSAKLFDDARQELVIKCATSQLDFVITAVAAKTEFRGSPIALRLKLISGMIGKLTPGVSGRRGVAKPGA
jgi:RNase P/RNase MRP subunit POP5